MSSVLPPAILGVVLLMILAMFVVGVLRRRRIEQRRRENQLYSVYKSQLRRERKDRR